MSYQGPNVQVTQKFVATPPSVAVDKLPPAGVGTAYDVYVKEYLSTDFGIANKEVLWGVDKVVFNNTVIGERLYNFYPAKTYAVTPYGNVELTTTKSATGATITKDQTYIIPGTQQLAGYCQAFVPFYNKQLATDAVKILSTDLSTVIALGASLSTSMIQPGQTVIVGNTATPSSFVNVGTVAAVGSDETKIKLTSAYSGAVTFDTIIVGAAPTRNSGDTAFINVDHPNCFYDPNADFIAAKVKVGDLSVFTSASFSGTITATITAVVNKNMIKFNTTTPTTGHEDWNFYTYKTSTLVPASTITISAYSIQRFVGFSKNYGYQALNTANGVVAVKVSSTSFKVALTSSAPLLSKGDYVAAVTTNSTTPTSFFKINTVTTDVTHQIYTTDAIILKEDGAEYVNGNFIIAWNPICTHDIVADFRAVRVEETQVVKRITSPADIAAAWCKDDVISPYNELAFAMSIALASAGGNACYGVNVDATAASLSAEYTAATEALKMVDVYSHFFCTTDGGVNAIMSPYCNEQSEPYEAHERIGIVVYDQNDIFLQGVDTGTTSAGGVITIGGSINLASRGVTVGDVVEIYNASGVLQATVDVTSTPDAGHPSVCHTNGTSAYTGATMTFKFVTGRKDEQANRISALGSGDRRVKTVWPGWFDAYIGTTPVTLPPYYISACKCGMDSVNKASQSFTNKNFSIPGISNIQLNTSSYFRKGQLDIIGGGGVDVTIQDGSVSQVICSRHDLSGNMDAVEYREWSITKQADVASKTIRSSTKPYIGKYNITQSLITFLAQVCSTTASTLIRDGIIANMAIKSITRDSVVADKINFNVTTTVFVAGNYYDIQMLIISK